MLTPLALSYTNIGPFADQTLQICVSNGSYLIQAPIGSGKSFLFFDGPLFALYKHRDRPILNKTSKKGAVEILFQLDSGIYMIRRELTMTKK